MERKPYRRAKEVVRFVKQKFELVYSERGMQALLPHQGYRRIKNRLAPGPIDEAKAFGYKLSKERNCQIEKLT